jgi:aminomethyltransferase
MRGEFRKVRWKDSQLRCSDLECGVPRRVAAAAQPQWTEDEFRVWRLERGIPRYGDDITEANLVQETRLMEAVSFSKGCYLGQEIVERVRSRGHVNRLLTPLRIEGPAPPRGVRVLAGEKDAGEVTSAAYSVNEGATRALAYVRAEFARKGVELQVGGAAAQVVEKA